MLNKYSLFAISALAVTLLAYLYWESLGFLFGYWIGSDDYSHGMLVPVVSAFVAWQSRDQLREHPRDHAWWGVAIIAVGLLLYVVGEVATLYVVLHVSLWIVIVGLVTALIGVSGARTMMFPLCYLLTAIPLPVFLYANLSSQLQLWSSALGVKFLQWVGVMAFREGNVIDLGPVQLQVVEACSGIRYLLPLTALAFLCAFLFRDKLWKRVLLVLSSIPISILVNGFRIGVIGVLVEWQGQGAAEGFSHLFEGWVLFMVSLGMIVLEAWLLANIGGSGLRGSFVERFTWVVPYQRRPMPDAHHLSTSYSIISTYIYGVALLIPFALISTTLAGRQEVPPPRAAFIDFPMQIKHWQGVTIPLEKKYIDRLRFDDYVLADYRAQAQPPVNFYVAYYLSQRKGQSAHSPQSCLPAGGWEIVSLAPVEWQSTTMSRPFTANRAVIRKNDEKQVVIYWFKQRDRILVNEYLVKWYLLWDAFSRQRTDGALVRLASPVGPSESEAEVDQRLMAFASAIDEKLPRFIPD